MSNPIDVSEVYETSDAIRANQMIAAKWWLLGVFQENDDGRATKNYVFGWPAANGKAVHPAYATHIAVRTD